MGQGNGEARRVLTTIDKPTFPGFYDFLPAVILWWVEDRLLVVC